MVPGLGIRFRFFFVTGDRTDCAEVVRFVVAAVRERLRVVIFYIPRLQFVAANCAASILLQAECRALFLAEIATVDHAASPIFSAFRMIPLSAHQAFMSSIKSDISAFDRSDDERPSGMNPAPDRLGMNCVSRPRA